MTRWRFFRSRVARPGVLAIQSGVVGCVVVGCVVVGSVVGGFVGCVVEPIDLNDRRCDDEHPCVEGYTCIKETCELDDDEDPGASG